jgi:hypothetical protein
MSSKPSRRLARLAGIVAGNLLALATTGFVHAGQAPGFAALPVIATAGCWDARPDDVLGAVRECAHKGVQAMTMAVRPGTDGQPRAATRYEATACTPSANCVSLDDLLDEMPAPKLLLQVSPTLLDAVQADVGRHGADNRVMIEPMLDRPNGNAASAVVAPGLHYSRRRLLSPRPMMVHILQVDLDTTGLRFVVSPGHPGHDAAGKPTRGKTGCGDQRDVLPAVRWRSPARQTLCRRRGAGRHRRRRVDGERTHGLGLSQRRSALGWIALYPGGTI